MLREARELLREFCRSLTFDPVSLQTWTARFKLVPLLTDQVSGEYVARIGIQALQYAMAPLADLLEQIMQVQPQPGCCFEAQSNVDLRGVVR